MTFISHADVKRLLDQPLPHMRASIAPKLAAELEAGQLTETERQLAYDIVRILAEDVDVTVRHAIAQNFRRSQQLPHDIAMRLAGDVEAVALPVLTDSLVLTDDDLIDILRRGSFLKQKTIAARPHISEKVSAAVVDIGSEMVVAALMDNATAEISDQSLGKAIDRFAASDMVKQGMVKRAKLPPAIAERLATIVTGKLQEHLMTHYQLPAQIITEVMRQGREQAVIHLSRDTSQADIERLVGQMYTYKRLTPSVLLRALCVGNLTFFECALAALADIPVVKARALIHAPGSGGLEAICQKAGLPRSFMAVIPIALEAIGQLPVNGSEQDIKRYRASLIERVLTQTDAIGGADVDYILEIIK